MMNSTKILMEEHDTILVFLSRLENLLNEKELSEIGVELLYYYSFIEEFADKYHHTKEEDIYFKWMTSLNENLGNGPISCMMKEHDEFRALVAKSKAAYYLFVKDADDSSKNECITNLQQFIKSMRFHIEKENDILYRMAENLNEATDEDHDIDMMAQFNAVKESHYEIVEKFL